MRSHLGFRQALSAFDTPFTAPGLAVNRDLLLSWRPEQKRGGLIRKSASSQGEGIRREESYLGECKSLFKSRKNRIHRPRRGDSERKKSVATLTHLNNMLLPLVNPATDLSQGLEISVPPKGPCHHPPGSGCPSVDMKTVMNRPHGMVMMTMDLSPLALMRPVMLRPVDVSASPLL